MRKSRFREKQEQRKMGRQNAREKMESSRKVDGRELDIFELDEEVEDSIGDVKQRERNVDSFDTSDKLTSSRLRSDKKADREKEVELRGRNLEPKDVGKVVRGTRSDGKDGDKRGVERRNADTRNRMPSRNRSQVDSEKRVVRIGIVLDGTLSFTTVYPKVFYVIERFLREMKRAQNKYSNVKIEYGLVIVRDSSEIPEEYIFDGDKKFTASENELLDVLCNKIEFWGGSSNGHENLEKAIMMMLENLNSESSDTVANNGLLMFTDSTQKEEESDYDLDFSDFGSGLRFANIYAYDDAFMPIFKIVDRYGYYAENSRNGATYQSLRTLLDQDLRTSVDFVRETIDQILQQTSVN